MSLTIVSRKPGKPRSRVRIGGEYDKDGVRGYVLLSVTPRLALLTRGAARDIARALVHFAEHVRPVRTKKPAQRTRPTVERAVVSDTAAMFRP